NIVISNTAAITFTVGSVDASTSTVVASPSVVPADNSSAATITVTLRDATSNGVPNKVVALSQTSGQGSPTITVVSDTTDGHCEANFTATSITPGTSVLTATDVTDGNLVITQTVELAFVSLVSWSGFATTVANESDVVTNGILLYAEHWAGFDATLNGVTFTPAQNYVVGSSDGYETLE